MKQTSIIILIFLISTNLFGQKTKKITYKNDYPANKEVFYVLKDDNSVKHGAYQKSVRGKVIIVGQFEHGKKVDVWEFYGFAGEVEHKYDYDDNKLVYNKSLKETKDANLLREAIPLGGYGSVYQNVALLLRYPADARRNGTQGKVFVSFIVGKDGKLSNITVTKGIGDGCHEETVRVFRMLEMDWLPALDKDGKPTNFEITLPITFKLG